MAWVRKYWMVLGCGLILAALYLAYPLHWWWLTPDSALYVGLAESISIGEGYTFDGIPHVHALPGLPFLLSPILGIWGRDFTALNLLMRCCVLLSVPLVFAALRRHHPDRSHLPALAAAAGVTAPAYFQWGLYVLSEPLAYLLSFALLYAIVRAEGDVAPNPRAVALITLLSLAAFLTRPILAAAPLSWLIAAALRQARYAKQQRGTQLLSASLPCAAVLAAATYWLLRQHLHPEGSTYAAEITASFSRWHPSHLWEGLRLAGSHLGRMFIPLREAPPWLGVIPASLALAGLARDLSRGPRAVTVYLLVYALSLAFFPYLRERYLAPLAPLVFYFAFAGARTVAPAAGRWLFAAALGTVLVYITADGIIVMNDRAAASPLTAGPIVRTPHWDPFVSAILELRDEAEPGRRVLTTHPRVTHVLTGLSARDPRPGESLDSLLAELDAGGFGYVVVDSPCFDPDGQALLSRLLRARPGAVRLVRDRDRCRVFRWIAPAATPARSGSE